MTQAIYNIPNQTAAALRLDLNNHLLAIVSQNSGAVAPSVTFAYQFWADTGVSPPMLRQRNAANAAWIAIAQLSNFGLPSVQLQSATAATTTNVGVAYSATQTPPTSGAKLVDATINADNSGALSTLALNGDAAKSIKQYSSTGTKIAAVLVAGMRATLMDDGTDWILMNPLPAIQSGVAVGATMYFPGNAAPTGYVKKNGALLSRTTYADLYAYAVASGNMAASDGAWTNGQFSPGDGTTTFRIPDGRGEFVRGWDDSRGIDSGRAIGSSQSSDNLAHTHGQNYGSNFGTSGGSPIGASGSFAGSSGYSTSSSGGSEARPRNIAELACIKY